MTDIFFGGFSNKSAFALAGVRLSGNFNPQSMQLALMQVAGDVLTHNDRIIDQDADRQRHGEPLDRSAAERKQHQGGDQRGDVGVGDGQETRPAIGAKTPL